MAPPASLTASRRGTRSMTKLEGDTTQSTTSTTSCRSRSTTRFEDTTQSTTKEDSSSSPLSSLNSTPNHTPIKHQKAGNNAPRLILRLNLKSKPLPESQGTVNHATRQASLKRKRTTAQIGAPQKYSRLNDSALSTSAPKSRTSKKTLSTINKEFSEASVVAYGLREIYNAIPRLPKNQLKLQSVPIETRLEVMQLAERFADLEASRGNTYLAHIRAVKLDLHLWENNVPNVCRVQYPFFEAVMEKLLFWVDRGKTYSAEQSSVAKYEEAKAVKAAQAVSAMTEEEQMRGSEINSVLSALQALKEEPLIGRPHRDLTHHGLRAAILTVANRFCIEQSRVGLDCYKLVEHLKADLHLCHGDFVMMKERRLLILSKIEIEGIMRKLADWFRGETVYQAGKRAVDMFADWYEDYSAVHHKMVSMGLFTQ